MSPGQEKGPCQCHPARKKDLVNVTRPGKRTLSMSPGQEKGHCQCHPARKKDLVNVTRPGKRTLSMSPGQEKGDFQLQVLVMNLKDF